MNEIKKLNVRVGDEVVVIAGTYKGKKGKILSVNPADNTCVVKDVNIVSKHKKMRKQGEKSEIKKIEGSINISNVQVICSKCGKATRIGHQVENKIKHRVCKKCGNILDKKYVKPKTKAEEKAEIAAEEKATKKPLQRREVKHVAESTVKKPVSATKKATAEKPDEKGGK